MNLKLQKIIEYINTNKHNKALLLLKKVNRKVADQNILSLQLEGVCYANQKKYKLAELSLNKALRLINTIEDKVKVITQLKELAVIQRNNTIALEYLKKLIILDKPSNVAIYALEICSVSFDSKDYQCVIEYAEKLLDSNNSTMCVTARGYLVASYAKLDEHSQVTLNFRQIDANILKVNPTHLKRLLGGLEETNQDILALQLLELLAEKYQNETWYNTASEKYKNLALSTIENTSNGEYIAKITSNNKLVKKLIEKLVKELIASGAVFNKKLEFVEYNGNLSIKSAASNDIPELQLQVPLTCMPLRCDYYFSITPDGVLCVKNKKKALNKNAFSIMKIVCDIYNATGKIEFWRKTYPLLSLKGYTEIVNSLFDFRPQGNKLNKFKELYDKGSSQSLLLDSFLGAREFTYSKEALASAGIKTNNSFEKGFLAIIDFLNHRTGDVGYKINHSKGCMDIVAASQKDSEICVQYSWMDPVLSLLIYGFVDVESPILFSGCTKIKTLSGLNINVLSMSGRLKSTENISSDLNHLKNFIPAGIKRQDDDIFISDLIIPNARYSNSLRDVLKLVLLKCDNEKRYSDNNYLLEEVVHLENQLIQKNCIFWQGFLATASELNKCNTDIGDTTKTDLINLSNWCLEHLNLYLERVAVK